MTTEQTIVIETPESPPADPVVIVAPVISPEPETSPAGVPDAVLGDILTRIKTLEDSKEKDFARINELEIRVTALTIAEVIEELEPEPEPEVLITENIPEELEPENTPDEVVEIRGTRKARFI